MMETHVLEVLPMFKNLTLTVVMIVILVVVMLPLPQQVKTVLVVLVILGLVFYRRGYIFVAIASRALNGKKPDEAKAWRYYELGWKAGLPPNYTIMLGNLFAQRGDAAVAARILDSVIEKQQRSRKPDAAIIASASTSRSMVYWVQGDIEAAIAILNKVRDSGQGDKNLYINLTSYLLESGRLEEAYVMIEEASAKMAESPGMADNRGWYLLLTGAYKQAEKLYHELLKDSKPRFPEAYAHAAQVKAALGKNTRARELYNEALTKPFYQTTSITKEEVLAALDALGDKDLEWAPDLDVEDDLEIEGLEDDEDLFEEYEPNTDVSDDDDGDPNNELDDEDYDDGDESEVEEDEEPELDSDLFGDEYDDEEDDRS
jgi:tetratricopeptide (TPR) repeat protein